MTTPAGQNADQQGQPSAQDTGTTAALDDLARRLAEAARGMQKQLDPQQVLDRVVSLAVAMVPGADEATITMVRARRHVYSAAATGELAAWFDVLQNETGEGPCLDAMWKRQTVRVDDLAADPRWPVLGPRAKERGVGSMLCLQLFVHEDTLGALDLLAHDKSAFTDESEHIGLLLASHAAIAVADAQKLEHAAIALVNRSTVAEIPSTMGTGGMPLWPLMSRRIVVERSFSSPFPLVLTPRCASSKTRYSVRSGSSIVFLIVSQRVTVRLLLVVMNVFAVSF